MTSLRDETPQWVKNKVRSLKRLKEAKQNSLPKQKYAELIKQVAEKNTERANRPWWKKVINRLKKKIVDK